MPWVKPKLFLWASGDSSRAGSPGAGRRWGEAETGSSGGSGARSRSLDVFLAVGNHGGDWLGGGAPSPLGSIGRRSGHRTKSGGREAPAEARAGVQRGAAAAWTRCGQTWEVSQTHQGQGLRTRRWAEGDEGSQGVARIWLRHMEVPGRKKTLEAGPAWSRCREDAGAPSTQTRAGGPSWLKHPPPS